MAVVGVRASGGSQKCAVEGAYAARISRQEREVFLKLYVDTVSGIRYTNY